MLNPIDTGTASTAKIAVQKLTLNEQRVYTNLIDHIGMTPIFALVPLGAIATTLRMNYRTLQRIIRKLTLLGIIERRNWYTKNKSGQLRKRTGLRIKITPDQAPLF